MDFYFIFSCRARPIAAVVQQPQPGYHYLLEPLDTVLHVLVQVRDNDELSAHLANPPHIGYNLDEVSCSPRLVGQHCVQGYLLND